MALEKKRKNKSNNKGARINRMSQRIIDATNVESTASHHSTVNNGRIIDANNVEYILPKR